MNAPGAKLTLPCDLAWLGPAKALAEAVAEAFGFAQKDRLMIALALEEALTNVVKHAFEDPSRAECDIILRRCALGLEIVIKEMGIPFDPKSIPDYDPARDPDAAPEKGLGVRLMRRAMDEVAFRNLGPEGKEVRLVKHLHARDVRAYFQEQDLVPETGFPPKPEAPPAKINYSVRRLAPEDAIEVSRCAYRCHGYTFFNRHIYYPERIVELNQSGLWLSAVAVADDGRFMGHAALVYDAPGSATAELTFVFVDTAFRGQGCMNRLVEYLFQTPKPTPLKGLTTYAVTNHPFSQKALARYGFVDCGLMLAICPETWLFKGMEHNTQRISCTVAFKHLADPALQALYPPKARRDLVAALYAGLGAKHRFLTPAERPTLPEEPSSIDVEIDDIEACAYLRVSRYGAHAAREIRAALKDLLLRGMAVVELYLPLADPSTFFLAPELESAGFFFCGILPLTALGEALILQYLNNVPLNYDTLSLASPTAQSLAAAIRTLDPNRI